MFVVIYFLVCVLPHFFFFFLFAAFVFVFVVCLCEIIIIFLGLIDFLRLGMLDGFGLSFIGFLHFSLLY